MFHLMNWPEEGVEKSSGLGVFIVIEFLQFPLQVACAVVDTTMY